MHNIHLNPFYIINNVIFINTKKKFVYLDRTAWDTIHRTIFGHRRSTDDQRKKLHQLFYDMYFGYVYSEDTIDARLFNDRIDCIKWNTESCDPIRSEGSATFYSETAAPIEGYIDDTCKIENEEVAATIRNYGVVTENHDIRERLTLFLNTLVSTSEDFRLLVEYIGFSRCLSKLTQFIISDQFRFYSESEGVLFRLFIERGSPELRFKITKRNFDFICFDCCNIGSHGGRKVPSRRITNTVAHCYPGFVRWFDKNGFIDIHSGVEDAKPKGKTLREQYLTKGKVNGYNDVTFFRYGMFTVDRDSEKDLSTLETENLVAIYLEDLKIKHSYCYKDVLNWSNSSESDRQEFNLHLNSFTSLLSSCNTRLKLEENYAKLEEYYISTKDCFRSVVPDEEECVGFAKHSQNVGFGRNLESSKSVSGFNAAFKTRFGS